MGKLYFKRSAFMCWQKSSRTTWSHPRVQENQPLPRPWSRSRRRDEEMRQA